MDCAIKAAGNTKAKFWTYVASTKECWIKTSNKEKKEASVAHVSGNVECGQKEGEWLIELSTFDQLHLIAKSMEKRHQRCR